MKQNLQTSNIISTTIAPTSLINREDTMVVLEAMVEDVEISPMLSMWKIWTFYISLL